MAVTKHAAGTTQKQFTRQEIEEHDKKDDRWIVVDGKVYDATRVMD
jgi:nitrate reductase (NAD(P)H)